MPVITINAEVTGSEGDVRANIYINKELCAELGPFADWSTAHAAANAYIKEVRCLFETFSEDLLKLNRMLGYD